MEKNNVLPEQFKTWIEFYDYLIKNIPGLKQKDNSEIVRFHIMKQPVNECDPYLKFNNTLGDVRAQCFREIEDLRPIMYDLRLIMSKFSDRGLNDYHPAYEESVKRIERLIELLMTHN